MSDLSEVPTQVAECRPTPGVTLIRRLILGDERAFRELYDRYWLTLYALAYGMVTDAEDATEVVRETFAEARRKAIRFDPRRTSACGWLAQLARLHARGVVWARAWPARAPDGNPHGRKHASQDP